MSEVTKLPVRNLEATLDQKLMRGMDGFINAVTGAGTTADSFYHTQFQSGARLSDQLLEALYTDHDLASTIVERVVHDALRSGYELRWPGATDQERRDVVDWAESTYHVTEETKQARVWARLFGGAGVFMGSEGTLSQPAILGREVRFLRAVPKPRLPGHRYYDGLDSQNYGKVQVYRYQQLRFNDIQEIEPFVEVHESRIVPFYGVRTTDRQMILDKGWGKSVLHRVYEVLLKFDDSFNSTLGTLNEMSVPVYYVDQLLQLLASENGELLAKRFQLINTAKSAYTAVILDAEKERFERVEARLSEANAIVEAAMQRVSGASGIPAVLLWGRSPSGQNATGASDLENWNQQVRSEQALELGPALVRIYEALLASPGSPVSGVTDLSIEFPSIETPSIQDRANLYQQIANADSQYEAMGAATAAQIARKRMSDPTGLFPTVDLEHLDELDQVRKEQLLNPFDPMESPGGPQGEDDDPTPA